MAKNQLVRLEEALRWSPEEVRRQYAQYVNPGFASLVGLAGMDRQFVRAEGVYLWDSEGRRYLDFVAAVGALNLGHNHPRVLAALDAVRGRPTFQNMRGTTETLVAALAHNLAQVTPGEGPKRTFFCNSGAEAIEGALKLARAYTGKPRFISCHGAFHGKTFGALSVSGRRKYQEPFTPLLPVCEQIPFGDIEALRRALAVGDVAAFIVEPVQGEGGIYVPPPGYLRQAQEACRAAGALLIVDEVQTGIGRTGTLFACQQEDVEPDILCLAKSLGGGIMPVGAFVARAEVWDKAYGGIERCLLHTSTFGGNAWAMAAGMAALEVTLEERLPERAAELGAYLLERLEELKTRHPLLVDVRGRGLLIGLEFARPEGLANRLTGGLLSKLSEEYTAALVASELLNRHGILTVYTINNPNVIRLEPPLVVTKEQLDEAVAALDEVLGRNRHFAGLAVSAARSAASQLLQRLRRRKGDGEQEPEA